TAAVGDVLTGKTFCNSSGCDQIGAMTNVGTENITPSTSAQTITAGYHNGSGVVAGDTNLVSGNIKSGVSIFDVAGDSNVVDTSSGDAVADDILLNKKAWVDGGEVTGAISTRTLSADSATVAEGFYAATTLNAVDSDLVAANIKKGTVIFGVTGSYETPPCNCTGGTIWGTRWCDNGNGTVTDLLGATVDGKTKGRCLVWLKSAIWGGAKKWEDSTTHDDAHTRAGVLASGAAYSDLSDGSVAGDWRLPTISELRALTTGTQKILSTTAAGPFSVLQSFNYWSSSTEASLTTHAWTVRLGNGSMGVAGKTDS
ncbi:DUF1566 domain-containing protein, partial [Thiospirillum jenense]